MSWSESGHQNAPYGDDGDPAEPLGQLVPWSTLAFRFLFILVVFIALGWWAG